MTSGTTRSKGFTLIEILICVVVLAVTTLALSRFHAVQQKSAMAASERLEATRLAERMIESALDYARTRTDPNNAGMDFSGIALTRTSTTAFDKTGVPGKTANYDVAIRFAAAPGWIDTSASTADDELAFKVQANITWADANGENQAVVLTQDVFQTKTDALASAEPVNCPAVASPFVPVSNDTYQQFSNKLHYCKATGGCNQTPSSAPDDWVVVRESCT